MVGDFVGAEVTGDRLGAIEGFEEVGEAEGLALGDGGGVGAKVVGVKVVGVEGDLVGCGIVGVEVGDFVGTSVG